MVVLRCHSDADACAVLGIDAHPNISVQFLSVYITAISAYFEGYNMRLFGIQCAFILVLQ